MTTREALLARIEAFLTEHRLTERRFGVMAANDHKLIERIRHQSVTLARIEVVERFMAGFAGRAPDDAASAPRAHSADKAA